MSITITRRLASQLRSVLRRAFGMSRGSGPALCFTVDAGTLSVKAASADVAVEYVAPGDGPAESLWLPYEFLADCEGKRDDPAQLEAAGDGRVTVQWSDRGVPQLVSYDAVVPADADKFPRLPETLAENPPRLLKALDDAFETTDPDSIRYSLGCVQCRSARGDLVATDGRQLLVQDGFAFPWDGDVLLCRTRLFGCPDLPQDQPVLVGKTEDRAVFQVGPWRFWLPTNKEGRFPDVTHHIPQADAATARCQLSAADAAFLTQSLPRLPGDDELNWPTTIDLNGSIAIRAKSAGQDNPTELVLSNSTWSGESVRLNTNRRYLARAVKLGFRELLFYGPKAPASCQGDSRRYVWALLDPESCLAPVEDAIRIESPGGPKPHPVPPSPPRRELPTVSESNTTPNSNGHASTRGMASANSNMAKVNGHARKSTGRAEQHDTTALIEQATKLRTSLHDLLHEASALVKALKQHRRQSRAIQNTLASLKQLKGLGV